jgi:hypothetical protein
MIPLRFVFFYRHGKSMLLTALKLAGLSSSVLSCSLAFAASGKLPVEVDYNFHIKPILSDRCYQCHGPDANARQADLRLDRHDARLGETVTEVAIIAPGAPDQSKLYRRISSAEEAVQMPPVDSKLPPLSEYEIALVRRWIEQGATWKEHWSFNPVEETPLPDVGQSTWVTTPVDHFVLAKLQRESIEPTRPATRETLLRRVTFDLTGLPPTVDQIKQYLSDLPGDAYQRAVERLLESPSFGERMATHWLDLARYSDTFGYQVDRDRRVWPWRDWVIRAFNQNVPYDQFLTWQIAGDLLEASSDDQILATTFNRLHPQKTEGGSTPEEFRVEYVADRLHTLATGLLGLTLECSRCHDHKYDPITQREYYRLFAFFNNIDEAGLYSYHTTSTPTPTLVLADEATKAKITDLDQRIEASAAQLESIGRQPWTTFDAWLAERPTETLIPGRIGYFPFDEMEEGKLKNLDAPETPATTSTANQLVTGKQGRAVRLTGDDGVVTKVSNFTRQQPFTVALWIQTPDWKERAVVWRRGKSWTDGGSRGYQLLLEEGCLSASLIHFWPGNAIRVKTRMPLRVQEWKHVAVTYDGSSSAGGLAIFVDGVREPVEVVRDNLTRSIQGGEADHLVLGHRRRDRGFSGGLVDELQVFTRQLTSLEIAQLFDGQSLRLLLGRSAEQLSVPERQSLFQYYLSTVDPDYRRQLADLKTNRQQKNEVENSTEEIMVMRELDKRRETYVLKRGMYDAPTDRVDPGTPSVLNRFPTGQPRNRLGLARWLTDPKNPLTARVAVNQFWQLFFGTGLVRTTEDFGSQGELPSHPKLLDWLARDFVNSGWDVKHLLKQIVMSSTYRQSSRVTTAQMAADPENRMLARGPSCRLPAEMIRDNYLAVSGLLVDRIGGPSVRPYEVAVSFKPVDSEQGDALYRRSMYTYWKRTGPAPVMMTLDASKRDVCVVKREKTSTPLQALVLLNDPQLVEAARILGQKMVSESGGDANRLVDEMFLLLTSRHPEPREREILLQTYREQLTYFQKFPERATSFLKTGETPFREDLDAVQLAAAGVLAEMLLNYDACIIKR